MIRVMHVITGLGRGGAEMALYRLIAKTNGRLQSSVVLLSADKAIGSEMDRLGVPVYSLEIRSIASSITGGLQLRRLLQKYKPDIVQGWMPHGNAAATLTVECLRNSPGLVWGVRQSLYDLKYEKPSTARLIRLNAILSRRTDLIIYNSRVARDHHEALGYRASRSAVIHNGFDTDTFAPSEESRRLVRKELGICNNEPIVGIVGRYHPMKDHRSFVIAAVDVWQRHRNCRFVMVGAEITWENIELATLLRNAGISHITRLLGARDDVARINAAFDVAVSSSFTESFPNVIGEAMSCGVPCVATDVGDSAMLVNNTGYVVPARNPRALSEAINRLLDLTKEDRRALGLSARLRICNDFSLERVSTSYSSHYLSIVEARPHLN